MVDGSNVTAWAIVLPIALTVGISIRLWFKKKLNEDWSEEYI